MYICICMFICINVCIYMYIHSCDHGCASWAASKRGGNNLNDFDDVYLKAKVRIWP